MHLHILGICGTFMGGIAVLARAAGPRVTGPDATVYPPMSTQLAAAGIEVLEGFAADQIALKPDLWVVGNVVTRGNPLVEEILDRGAPFTSGPQWLPAAAPRPPRRRPRRCSPGPPGPRGAARGSWSAASRATSSARRAPPARSCS